MTTLTDPELIDIRLVVGDSCTDPFVSDDTVQGWYDLTPTCMAQVYVYYLQRLWMKAINEPKNLVTLGNVAVNVKAGNIERVLTYWSKDPCVANTLLATITVGSIDLGIDTTWDTIEADLLNDVWPY